MIRVASVDEIKRFWDRVANPSHLFLGTQAENMGDCARKLRKRHGESHRCAKLTEHDVRLIRASSLGPATLGRRFGITTSHVCQIIARKKWRHSV